VTRTFKLCSVILLLLLTGLAYLLLQREDQINKVSDDSVTTTYASNIPSVPLAADAPIAQNSAKIVPVKDIVVSIVAKDVSELWKKIMNSLSANVDIDLEAEQQLIEYLKHNDDDAIYADIIAKLTAAGSNSEETSRSQQYLLSLLTMVNSERSVGILLDTIATVEIVDSNAIYATKKSIERLARSPQHVDVIQNTFLNINDDNLFVDDLSNAIARNAQPENLDFLIGYIDVPDSYKKQAVVQSMIMIRQEKLVPHLQTYLESQNSSANVKQVALESLAYMGQYEAASALIKWSATQSMASLDQVTKLFNIALDRSPSAKRSITKELDDYDFNESAIKQGILRLASIK